MHLINPNNGKPIISNTPGIVDNLPPDIKKKRHYAAIKIHAEQLLKECHSDAELRLAVVKMYHNKLREHQVEITAHPENSVNYLLASLEVFQVCLQHVFTAIQQQEAEQSQSQNQVEKESTDNGTKTES
jgi:hypothetical protein